jgi:hypothetical protein
MQFSPFPCSLLPLRFKWCPQHPILKHKTFLFQQHASNNTVIYTRWFKYDRDYLCVNKSQFVPVIFEPACTNVQLIVTETWNLPTCIIQHKLYVVFMISYCITPRLDPCHEQEMFLLQNAHSCSEFDTAPPPPIQWALGSFFPQG